ncbi:MAG: hypothetical protein KatS3mg028_1247 [Bacteroidia bacterium]|nr:MAG: hypothetical protein KatS3mg028_1247 [Bacteroidia bacterium]
MPPLMWFQGDFYWFHQVSDFEAYLALVDCTGHGIAGALMSVIGHTELNKAIKERRIREPKGYFRKLCIKTFPILFFSQRNLRWNGRSLVSFSKNQPFSLPNDFCWGPSPFVYLAE